MSRQLSSVAAALLLAGAATACSDPTSPSSSATNRTPAVAAALNGAACGGVLGPTTYTRQPGTPEIALRRFSAAPGDWYKLVLLGADAATVRVALNGEAPVSVRDNAARIEVPVTLLADNVIELRLGGRAGSSVVLSIVDTRAVASLRIVPTVVQGTAYVLAGSTRDFGAEVLDAQGRAITTACVTWRTTDPAIATVNADGIVQGVATGTTQLIVSAGGVERSERLTVLSPAGATRVDGRPGPCIWSYDHYFGCFSSVVTATPVVGDQTLIEVSIFNRQTQSQSGPWSLPPSVISGITVMTRSQSATQTGALSVALDSGVTVVGSTPIADVFPWAFMSMRGWHINVIRGVSGCETPVAAQQPAADWRTCGNSGDVTFSFVVGGSGWSALPMTLNVTMLATGSDQFLNSGTCATGAPDPFENCRPFSMYP